MKSHLENALDYLLLAKQESQDSSFERSQMLNKAIENISLLLTEPEDSWTPPNHHDFLIADLLIETCQ